MPFEFEKTIHPDRFLMQNRSKMDYVKQNTSDLKNQKKKLEDELKELSNFVETMSIHNVLKKVNKLAAMHDKEEPLPAEEGLNF
jgi:hypothetical protein